MVQNNKSDREDSCWGNAEQQDEAKEWGAEGTTTVPLSCRRLFLKGIQSSVKDLQSVQTW